MISYENRNPSTLNFLKAMYFDHPDWTPCAVWFLPAAEAELGEALDDLRAAHPRLFPGFVKPERREPVEFVGLYAAGEYTDNFGCVWRNSHPGMIGQVVEHPLADWSALESWTPPDPETQAPHGPRDWEALEQQMRFFRNSGHLGSAMGLAHGFLYLLLCDLRGFENLMMDLITDDPRLSILIDKIVHYNVCVTKRLLDMGAEYMNFAEDLGTQKALPISPDLWRKRIKPCYEAILGLCRDRDVPVWLHSDGHILPIIPDLVECGVRVLNMQVGPNGLEGLKRVAQGKVAIDLDIDRTMLPFAKPQEIFDHIRDCHDALWMPEGGLMIHTEVGCDMPLENIDAMFSALEEICRLP